MKIFARSLLTCCLLSGAYSQSAPSVSKSESLNNKDPMTIDFYRSTESLFRSGQNHFNELLKTEKKRFYKYQAHVRRGSQAIQIPVDYILTDLQTSSLFLHTPTQKTFRYLQQQSSWVYAEDTDSHEKKWLLLSDLAPVSTDYGLAVNLGPAFLKNKAYWLSSTKHVYPSENRFLVLGFQKGWVKVRSLAEPALEGFIDGNNLITRFDFASMVSTKKPSILNGVAMGSANNHKLVQLQKIPAENWVSVKYRDEDHLITDSDEKIPINEVKSLITRPDLAIVIKPLSEPSLLLKQHLKIIDMENALWVQSEIKGHGDVFWKWPKPIEKPLSLNEFTTAQILKREIFSMSIHPKNSKLGIVSANGIFLTTNGKTWRRLDSFNYDNHPVLITEKNQIYVGDKLSHDFANSFHPYFRWEDISKIVFEQNKKAHELRLSNVELVKGSILKLHLDTGSRQLTIASKLDQELRPVRWNIY